jgi:3-oxoacyl-[acyl-carrier-protein] synthase-3
LLPGNLHATACAGRVRPGDLVLLFSIGSVASATAAVVRWSDTALGIDPFAEQGATAAA